MNLAGAHAPTELYLDVLPHVDARDNEARLKVLEQRLRADEVALFVPAENAVLALRGRPATKAHVMCLLLLARRHQYNLEFEAAAACSSAAVELSRIIDDPECRAKALKFLGLVLFEGGRVAESIPIQLAALEHARTARDPLQISETLNNLGISLLYGARYGVAEECFAQAIEALPTSPTTWSNKGQLLLEVGEIALGLEAAQHGVSLITNSESVQWKVVRVHFEVLLVQLRVAIGDIQQATEHSKTALAEAAYSGQFATRLAGLAALLVNAHDPSTSAKAINSLLHEVHRNETHFSLYRTSLHIVVAALQAAGRPEEALHFLRQATELAMSQRARVDKQTLPGISDRSLGDLDHLADARNRGHFDSLRVQAGRSAAATDERVEDLVGLAIRAELREEDAFSGGEHVYRVARLAELVSGECRYSNEEVAAARLAGLLHDLGKVFAPDQVLLKRDVLTSSEKALIRRHAEDGAGLIDKLRNKGLVAVSDAVRHSHERWDGRGYPKGLKGESIPVLARIIALCDSFDAMTHWRPFRSPRSFAAAISEIEAGSGSRYDPRLSWLFIALMRRLNRENEDLDRFLADGAESSPVIQEQRRLAKLLRPQRETL